ncbi:hypothetical protein [Microvirga flavescens]|uniref:hypothetical protein n=1 Tax=Microvirga flavescens TaxID=2249811 RepID=UPI000DDA949D|nr:hypothetical protein [Microvirga flavescens]
MLFQRPFAFGFALATLPLLGACNQMGALSGAGGSGALTPVVMPASAGAIAALAATSSPSPDAILAGAPEGIATPSNPNGIGSGVLSAITDAQNTRVRHRATSFILNTASSFDPTGLSGHAVGLVEQVQDHIEEEQQQRIDAEVEKAIAEGMALQAKAQKENTEPQKAARTDKTARKKPTP